MDKIKPLRTGDRQVKRTPLSGRPWRRTRDYALRLRRKESSSRDVSLCEHCEALGRPYTLIRVECHHRTPRRVRPDLTHSLANLQFLCKEHHSLRTLLENTEKTGAIVVTGKGCEDYCRVHGGQPEPNPTAAYRLAIRIGATVLEL